MIMTSYLYLICLCEYGITIYLQYKPYVFRIHCQGHVIIKGAAPTSCSVQQLRLFIKC